MCPRQRQNQHYNSWTFGEDLKVSTLVVLTATTSTWAYKLITRHRSSHAGANSQISKSVVWLHVHVHFPHKDLKDGVHVLSMPREAVQDMCAKAFSTHRSMVDLDLSTLSASTFERCSPCKHFNSRLLELIWKCGMTIEWVQSLRQESHESLMSDMETNVAWPRHLNPCEVSQ